MDEKKFDHSKSRILTQLNIYTVKFGYFQDYHQPTHIYYSPPENLPTLTQMASLSNLATQVLYRLFDRISYILPILTQAKPPPATASQPHNITTQPNQISILRPLTPRLTHAKSKHDSLSHPLPKRITQPHRGHKTTSPLILPILTMFIKSAPLDQLGYFTLIS